MFRFEFGSNNRAKLTKIKPLLQFWRDFSFIIIINS